MGNFESAWFEAKEFSERRPQQALYIDLEAKGRAVATQRIAEEARQVEAWHAARQAVSSPRLILPLVASFLFVFMWLAAH